MYRTYYCLNVFKRICLSSVILFLSAIPVDACLWDYDTLLMERYRFPNTLELITGKFNRHSQEFYQWRIQDRQKKLTIDPDNLSYLDDLAVAYDKTNQHQKAIETILKKNKIKPGMYETEANLGTFYIHSKQYEKGLVHIKRAIEINPNAHFGREVYQKLLVEYLIDKVNQTEKKITGYQEFVLQEFGIEEESQFRDTHVKKALKGVQGMMRFGQYDSPVLLEALGDLLLFGSHPTSMKVDAKRMAARAYLKAAYSVEDKEAKKNYRTKAEDAISGQYGFREGRDLELSRLEKQFNKEMAEADNWFQKVRADEITWIQAGKDVDAQYAAKYYDEPKLAIPFYANVKYILFTITLVAMMIAGVVWFWLRHRAVKKYENA